jgi:hypothetical protein
MLLQLLKLLPLLLPVLAFLGVLVYFDSFKLLRGRLLVALIFLGLSLIQISEPTRQIH